MREIFRFGALLIWAKIFVFTTKLRYWIEKNAELDAVDMQQKVHPNVSEAKNFFILPFNFSADNFFLSVYFINRYQTTT
jgi:hypothetical protein